ncbi:hypothetical protein P7C73_g2522, partial [Tremellales sp. Uapishka_1]
MEEATTSNYFAVAAQDDRISEDVKPEVDDKATSRSKRIAAAVERSKTEYKPHHAYTEAGWYDEEDGGSRAGVNSKMDQYRLEFLSTASSFHSSPADTMSRILPEINYAKPYANLSKELLDIAILSAIQIGNEELAVSLARASKPAWKGQLAGMSARAADALNFAKKPREALLPLLTSLSTYGLHYPILLRLSDTLKTLQEEAQEVVRFAAMVEMVLGYKKTGFHKPLFEDDEDHPIGNTKVDGEEDTNLARNGLETEELSRWDKEDIKLAVEKVATELMLDQEGKTMLEGTWRRLEKALRGGDEGASLMAGEREERGVREL